MEVTARAHSNIALIKYWGKADRERNLPAVPSLSMTLNELFSETRARVLAGATRDHIELNGRPADAESSRRIARALDKVRALCERQEYLEIKSTNNFPTAAGLASSASGFAALVLAASRALNLELTPAQLSDHARQASASAARSIFGGYVQLPLGAKSAMPLASAEDFPLALLVAVTAQGPKAIGSTAGMLSTQATSPYYPAWVQDSKRLFSLGCTALRERDLTRLGEAMEQSTMMMHASMLAASPAIMYFNPVTVRVIERVKALRAAGTPAYFTMDAGPHVKVLTSPNHAAEVATALADCEGVLDVISCQPGPAAHCIAPSSSNQGVN